MPALAVFRELGAGAGESGLRTQRGTFFLGLFARPIIV